MAKTSVLQRPKVDISTGRHDFDRSYTSNSNQSHGELRMVFCEPVVAGTKGVINAKMFTRTAKVVFPAFQQVDQHIEFFKVPLRFLWSKWNDWKANINDLNSSRLVDFSTTVGNYGPDLHMNVGCPRINIGNSGGTSFINRIGLTSGSDKVQVYKMLDDCNEGPLVNGLDVNGATGSCMVNLFPQAAYQKVYYDHFRNSTYESNNVYAYNLDWLQDNGGTSAENVLEPSDGTKNAWVTKELFTIRYKNYRNDYFHNLYPSLNYSQSQPTGQDWVLPNNLQGVANLVNPGDLDSFDTGSDYGRWLQNTGGSSLIGSTNVITDSSNSLVEQNVDVIRHNHSVNGSSQLSNRATINVQQIRAMFALDKLMRASAYAPKHVKQQWEALWGVKLSDKVSFESERLGSFMNTIVFGEVTATSDTYNSSAGTGQQLGAIGGKGVGFTGFRDDLHFYCEEDSLIIGIQYFLARANYDNYGIDEWAMKLTRNDFFIRPFEHLGLRPLYKKQFSYTGNSTTDNHILGFQEANMRYKVGIDRNHGLFNTDYLNYSSGAGTVSQSELSSFIVHTNMGTYVGAAGGVDYRYFKAFPSHLDWIFEQNYDLTDMSTDQFFGQTHFKFYVNAPMDVHSQPFL